MCGILGIVGNRPVTPRLIDGLKRLEYRGYDSAGIAVISAGTLNRSRAKGKIVALEAEISHTPIDGRIGIAHTRWATHGKPTVANAHPHIAGRVGVVHNGIIENYAELRKRFKNAQAFESETDTEVIAHIMNAELNAGLSPKEAFKQTLKQLDGAFALGVIVDGIDDHIFAARRGSPLAIGLGAGENYIGSDAIALSSLSPRIVYLEEGDWAIITASSVEIFDETNTPVNRPVVTTDLGAQASSKGDFDHYMLKEIHEQVQTVTQTQSHYLSSKSALPLKGLNFAAHDRLTIIACGTASYAGHVGKYWVEQLAQMPCEIDIASEFRYRKPAVSKNDLAMVVSQSGETADTLAALRYCKSKGLKTIALVNVMTSTMAREADVAIPIDAGPEIGVASTKAFTSQLTALLSLSILAARQRGVMNAEREAQLVTQCHDLSKYMSQALLGDAEIQVLAKALAPASSAFYLGRGPYFPLALEGALKLKEISYIHAEGYAAGELKHGPIALIETGTPVIVIAPYDDLFEKTVSNMQEVMSRGAKVTLITDSKGAKLAGEMADHVLIGPDCPQELAPIVYSVAIQLLSYHTALELGTDVDQPRNLAKSVTVE